MNESEIRKAIIYENEDVRYLIISAHAAKLMKRIIKWGTITTSEFSERSEISIQNASSQLKALFNKGYLLRKEVISKTGGIEYVYKSAIN